MLVRKLATVDCSSNYICRRCTLSTDGPLYHCWPAQRVILNKQTVTDNATSLCHYKELSHAPHRSRGKAGQGYHRCSKKLNKFVQWHEVQSVDGQAPLSSLSRPIRCSWTAMLLEAHIHQEAENDASQSVRS